MSKICLIFAANASESSIDTCLQALSKGQFIFLTDFSNTEITDSSTPDLSKKRVGTVYSVELNEKQVDVDAFSYGETEQDIQYPSQPKLRFTSSRFVVYLDVNDDHFNAEKLDIILNPDVPVATATKKHFTQLIMKDVTAVKVLHCTIDDLKTNLENVSPYNANFALPDVTEPVVSPPALDEEKCKKAITLLTKQCKRYQAHLDKYVTDLERKKTKLEKMQTQSNTAINDPGALQQAGKNLLISYKISFLELKIQNANEKKTDLMKMITFKENSLAIEQLTAFQKQFEAFSERFKPMYDDMAMCQADAKFKRRVVLAFATVGIYALVRGYRLGTHQFWKSHKEVLAKKAAAIEKELPTKPIKPKKQ